MSTRANIKFQDGNDIIHLDRSHDGFPDVILPDIKEAIAQRMNLKDPITVKVHPEYNKPYINLKEHIEKQNNRHPNASQPRPTRPNGKGPNVRP